MHFHRLALATIAAALTAAAGSSGCSGSAAAQESAPALSVEDDHTARIAQLRQKLAAENIIDQPGTVATGLCSADDADALNGATFATCESLVIRTSMVTSRAYLFSRSSRQLIVFHEGHNAPDRTGLSDALMPDARALLTELLHFSDVLYFDMPLLGVNSGQTLRIKGRDVSATTHDRFALLDEPGRSALASFLNPVDLALDQLAQRYDTIRMVGRSGGGWTTTLYAALDTRIVESISVAGTAPIAARGIDLDGRDDLGDWEQYGASIYRWLDYQDLYALAGSGGRRHEQLYLEHDNCCFSGIKGGEARQIFEADYGTGLPVTFTVLAGASDHYSMPISRLVQSLRD